MSAFRRNPITGRNPPLTRAREIALASSPNHRQMRAMAGSPLKRQRKLGVRAEDGSVITFPRLTHPTASLSHAQWRALGPAEKIERLLGLSLDRCYEILSWPIGGLDPFRLSVQIQVIRVVLMIGAKAYLNGSLGREAASECERDRILSELTRREFGDKA
jgi:hypothetical protein